MYYLPNAPPAVIKQYVTSFNCLTNTSTRKHITTCKQMVLFRTSNCYFKPSIYSIWHESFVCPHFKYQTVLFNTLVGPYQG